ncbi:MAG: NYN domain-containing protein [Acidimicrobiia bacterium]
MPNHRLALLVDWQNAYRSARATYFGSSAFHTKGQFSPTALGQRIAERQVSRVPRELTQVRIYRGAPNPRKDPKSAAAQQRQAAEWDLSDLVVVRSRALRYPGDWPDSKPEEKGIDVHLAIDLVAGYLRDEFDVAVILSRDTDQIPALELACEIADEKGKPLPEVATWTTEHGKGNRLRVPGREIRCHWLLNDDYFTCQDDTDYNVRPN